MLVKICPECCASNSDAAIFCSSCGIQLTVSPPVPAEVAQRYESLDRSLGELTDKSRALEDELKKGVGEAKAFAEQLRTDEQARRTEMQRELSDRYASLQDRLQKFTGDLKDLAGKVEANEQARKAELEKVSELVQTNRDLLRQVRRLSGRPSYCERCGSRLIATSDPNVALCPVCNVSWSLPVQTYYPPSDQAIPVSPGAAAWPQDYTHPYSVHAERLWHGIYIHENCAYCGQPLQQTTDPTVLYCPHCRKYQYHYHK